MVSQRRLVRAVARLGVKLRRRWASVPDILSNTRRKPFFNEDASPGMTQTA